jgi:hypothetical protein
MRRLALGVVFLLPTSCSLMFVNGPPEHTNYVEPGQCTTSEGWPAFDVVIAVLEAARTGYAVTLTDADYKGSTLSRPSDIGIGAALTALAAISAGVGFSRVSDCNDAINGTGYTRPRPPLRRRVVAPPSYAPPAAEPSVEDQTPPAPAAAPAPVAPAAPAAPRSPQQTDPE